MEEAPFGMLWDIMGLRNYARAREAIAQAPNPEDVPDSPAVDMVFKVEEHLWKQREAAKATQGDEA